MTNGTPISTDLNCSLSFRPFLEIIKRMIEENKPGAKSLYGDLVESLEEFPELLEPMVDYRSLHQHQKIIDTLCATIFPPASTKNELPYAVTEPFGMGTIYASQPFRKMFMDKDEECLELDGEEAREKIELAIRMLGYSLVMHTFYEMDVPDYSTFIFSYEDPNSSMKKMEAKLDARFMEVRKKDENFTLPEKTDSFHLLNLPELEETLPLDQFIFEGVTIIDVIEVTEREIVSEIKTDLITLNSFADGLVYDSLQVHIEALLGLKKIEIGITPFFYINDYYLFSEVHAKHSLLFANPELMRQHEKMIQLAKETFQQNKAPLIFEELDGKTIPSNSFLQYYFDQGFRSLIICPIFSESELLGLLELGSRTGGDLKPGHLSMLEQIIPLFTLALEKGQENLEVEIDRKIKENFTAIQSAVEWKFTEVVFDYIQQKQFNENAKLQVILFENVYPLYGAIDIRNSSAERSSAVQQDLITQLKLVKEIGTSLKPADGFPLLREIIFKTEGFLQLDPAKWLSEDDMTIHAFLREDVHSLFSHMKQNMSSLAQQIDGYFKALDPDRQMIYDASKRYEESIGRINETLGFFVDREQLAAQKIFPHYFERYVTDGIEFNIYIGQSITPHLKFDEVYLRNLKMWQLEFAARAAKLTHHLEDQLPLPLQTTQLILAHSLPITISFRNKERKFDVDGAYNARYEVIKKRIDKVNIKDTGERLTQPGKLAIVYSQAKDALEYTEYLQFLQNQNLLQSDVEELELEELQGLPGLKALRVGINFN